MTVLHDPLCTKYQTWSVEKENRRGLGWEGKNAELLNEQNIQVFKSKTVLKMDAGNDVQHSECISSPSGMINMVKVINFMLCMFYPI